MRGGKHLYRSHARPDCSSGPVKGFYHRVRAVAFCLGCEPVNKRSRQQSSDGGGERYQPQPVSTDHFAKNSALFVKSWRMVTGEREQENPRSEPQRPNK